MNRSISTTLVIVAISVGSAHAGEASNAPSNGNFERIKKLVGTWEGTHKTKNGEEKVPLTYELSSGGTVVVEKLSPGQPHEMITVYHVDGKDLVMTHYCMAGNQPTMKAMESDKNSISFDFVRATNMSSPSEPHMHSLKMTTPDAKHLTQEWSFFQDGKSAKAEVFAFQRVK